MSASLKKFVGCTLLACILGTSMPLLAEPPSWSSGHRGGPRGGPGWQGYWGPRYGVPKHYPAPGRMVPAVPRSRVVVWGGVNYHWGGGVWYRPWGPGFMVVTPPMGVVVPVLPPAYVVRSIGATTYYLSNDVYYTANPAGSGYIVAAPPEGETYASQGAVPAGERIFVYPRDGQSTDRQDRDRFDCHEWAMGQSGFDPMQPQSGSNHEVDARRSDYNRAFGACMDGRGYTVR